MDIRAVGETVSTNDDVAACAREGAGEGLWVWADRQSGGRGRMARAWVSPPGNLYASTLVRSRAGDPPAATLGLVAAVALDELIAAYLGAGRVLLKWPNDVMAIGEGKGWAKLSGILIERAGDAIVIGFGVNLAHAPDVPDRRTSSLAAEGVAAPEPAGFLEELTPAFARWLARWRGEGLEPVRQRWLARAHAKGTPLSVRAGDGPAIDGLFDGLAADGALRLRLADGTTHVMHAGDVFLL